MTTSTAALFAATATAAGRATATPTPGAAASGGIDTPAIFLLAFAAPLLVICFCTYFAEWPSGAWRGGADPGAAADSSIGLSLAAWRTPAAHAASARLSAAQLDTVAPRWMPGTEPPFGRGTDGDCACCLQPLVAVPSAEGNQQRELRTLAACGHAFHAACLEAWMCGAPGAGSGDSAPAAQAPGGEAPTEDAPDSGAHTVVDIPTDGKVDLTSSAPASGTLEVCHAAEDAASSAAGTALGAPTDDKCCCMAGDAVAMEAMPKGPSGTCPICRAVYRAGV
ncbi:hypothetical protein DFJ74DRAFT_726219 [Hyaloraphidium curvatum]|nr:hypothetical protein DFJ74DRAFT_647800 [Hyaloraphidium curvatum]KAI9033054.1 hypothetical protein DFJ74DRAFT_726219 [Hyaloraphidium curvatum]